MWYDEVNDNGKDFKNGEFGMQIGPFTQLVWKGTKELGCGISGGYVVCQYCNGPGNKRGQFRQNVFPAAACGKKASPKPIEGGEGSDVHYACGSREIGMADGSCK